MCISSESLRVSPFYSCRVATKRKSTKAYWLRAEAHCHRLNCPFHQIPTLPVTNLDFFINSVSSRISQKKRIRN